MPSNFTSIDRWVPESVLPDCKPEQSSLQLLREFVGKHATTSELHLISALLSFPPGMAFLILLFSTVILPRFTALVEAPPTPAHKLMTEHRYRAGTKAIEDFLDKPSKNLLD